MPPFESREDPTALYRLSLPITLPRVCGEMVRKKIENFRDAGGRTYGRGPTDGPECKLRAVAIPQMEEHLRINGPPRSGPWFFGGHGAHPCDPNAATVLSPYPVT